MRRVYNHIRLAFLAFALSTLAISCSDDEFMYNWDSLSSDETSAFYDISESIEYRQYLESLFDYDNAVAHPDTSKAIAVYIKDSLIVYVNS